MCFLCSMMHCSERIRWTEPAAARKQWTVSSVTAIHWRHTEMDAEFEKRLLRQQNGQSPFISVSWPCYKYTLVSGYWSGKLVSLGDLVTIIFYELIAPMSSDHHSCVYMSIISTRTCTHIFIAVKIHLSLLKDVSKLVSLQSIHLWLVFLAVVHHQYQC